MEISKLLKGLKKLGITNVQGSDELVLKNIIREHLQKIIKEKDNGDTFECDDCSEVLPYSFGYCPFCLAQYQDAPEEDDAKKVVSDKEPMSDGVKTVLESKMMEVLIKDISNDKKFQYREPGYDISDLVQDLAENGQINPITLKRRGKSGYQIISGHRRYEAAVENTWDTIKAVVYENIPDDHANRLAISENMRRIDLTDLETVKIAKALSNSDLKPEKIAIIMNRTSRMVSYYLKLNNSGDLLKKWLHNGIGITKAIICEKYKAILTNDLLKTIVNKELSVKQTKLLLEEFIVSKNLDLSIQAVGENFVDGRTSEAREKKKKEKGETKLKDSSDKQLSNESPSDDLKETKDTDGDVVVTKTDDNKGEIKTEESVYFSIQDVEDGLDFEGHYRHDMTDENVLKLLSDVNDLLTLLNQKVSERKIVENKDALGDVPEEQSVFLEEDEINNSTSEDDSDEDDGFNKELDVESLDFSNMTDEDDDDDGKTLDDIFSEIDDGDADEFTEDA